MSQDPHDRRPNIVPALKYKDAHAAIDWLQRAFGFSKQAVYPAPDGTVGHAELTLGAGAIMLGSQTAPDPANPWADAAHGVYVYVFRASRVHTVQLVPSLALEP